MTLRHKRYYFLVLRYTKLLYGIVSRILFFFVDFCGEHSWMVETNETQYTYRITGTSTYILHLYKFYFVLYEKLQFVCICALMTYVLKTLTSFLL